MGRASSTSAATRPCSPIYWTLGDTLAPDISTPQAFSIPRGIPVSILADSPGVQCSLPIRTAWLDRGQAPAERSVTRLSALLRSSAGVLAPLHSLFAQPSCKVMASSSSTSSRRVVRSLTAPFLSSTDLPTCLWQATDICTAGTLMWTITPQHEKPVFS